MRRGIVTGILVEIPTVGDGCISGCRCVGVGAVWQGGDFMGRAAKVLTYAHRHIDRCEVRLMVPALLDSRSPKSGQVRPIMKEAHLNSESPMRNKKKISLGSSSCAG
jgi:hypothetical protein